METSWWHEKDKVLYLRLWIQPGAKKTMILGVYGDCLKIKVHAPPVEGKANEAVLHFIAGLCEVKANKVSIKSGLQSRKKVVAIQVEDVEPILTTLGRKIGA